MIQLAKYLKPYRWAIAAVMVLTFLQVMSNLYLPTLMSDLVDRGIVNGDISYIWRIGGLMLLVAAGGVVFSVISSFFSSGAAMGFGKIIRGKMFSQVENFALHGFDEIGTASLITRTTNDIMQVQQVTAMMLRMMVMSPMNIIGGVIMATSKDGRLSIVIVAAIPLVALAIFLIARKGIPLFKQIQKKLDQLNLIQREGLTGIRVIRSFNRIEHEKKRFDESNLEFRGIATKVNRIMSLLMPIMMLTINFSLIAIIWFGGIRINNGSIQVGDMMAFIQYAMQILFSLMMLSMMFVMIPRASVSAGRINEVLNMKPTIIDTKEPKKSVDRHGEVEFRDVSFSYPGAEKPALSGISFTAEPGEVTAIIGGTGSGKSTMINLIPRFYDVENGSIVIDGVDVREYTQAELRSKIGFVPQKAVLFTGTVTENIRYGKEDATQEEVEYAAKTAQAAEFIDELSEGYETAVSQGGKNLSGGQKQRLSIARALVRKPEIYVFDDSFSALDFKTDGKLRAALQAETKESTVLIVAQRVTTVMNSHRIIVLDEGRIAGIGKHKELMDNCEIYREIVASQLSEEEIA